LDYTTTYKLELSEQFDYVHYDTFHVDALLQGLKYVARTCIDHNLKNQKELFAFLEEN
jgi:hypothetical protein